MAQEDLINSDVYKNYDLVLLQEPFIDSYGNTKATKDWWVTYPSHHLTTDHPVCSVILVNANLDTNSWVQHSIPWSNDLTAIQFKGNTGTIDIYNIYNNCHHNETMEALDLHLQHWPASSVDSQNRYMLWCSDFNRHHLLWDEERNHHLFMAAARRAAVRLLKKVLAYRMLMILPKGTPTLEAKSTKSLTCPDNVFCSVNAEELVVICDMDPHLRGLGVDHMPILTTLELPLPRVPAPESRNFRMVDWVTFCEALVAQLINIPSPAPLTSEAGFQAAVSGLTEALQATIQDAVLLSKPCPHSKCWWSSKLSELKRKKNKLSSLSYWY